MEPIFTDWESYQAATAGYNRNRLQFEQEHANWLKRKQTIESHPANGAIILFFCFVILGLLYMYMGGLEFHPKILVSLALLFGLSTSIDDWRQNRRLKKHLKKYPEPIFSIEEPVWGGSEEKTSAEGNEQRTDKENSGANHKLSSWEILEIPATASQAEIKEAYRLRMKEYHPDKVAHLGIELRALAEKKAKEINEAYAELREPWNQ